MVRTPCEACWADHSCLPSASPEQCFYCTISSASAVGRRQVWQWLCAGLVLPALLATWRRRRHGQRPVPYTDCPGQTVPFSGSTSGDACDVFICHRGPDVKRNIVGTIKRSLQRANLTVFVDYEMRKGVQSWQHISATLRGARGVLILLSPGFEESPWCLEEARAAAARLDAVLPVFLDREASWDKGKLRAAFNKFLADRDFHELRAEQPPDSTADIVKQWREALDSVAGISYLTHSSESRCDFAIKPFVQCLRYVQ